MSVESAPALLNQLACGYFGVPSESEHLLDLAGSIIGHKDLQMVLSTDANPLKVLLAEEGKNVDHLRRLTLFRLIVGRLQLIHCPLLSSPVRHHISRELAILVPSVRALTQKPPILSLSIILSTRNLLQIHIVHLKCRLSL